MIGRNPVSQKSSVKVVRGRSPFGTRIRGEIFTDYYFGEANTANKSDNLHNIAINENLNWGGISGLLQPHLYKLPRAHHKQGSFRGGHLAA